MKNTSGSVPTTQTRSIVQRQKLQVHSLLPLLVGRRFLLSAARACMRRGSAPGCDGITWRQYRQDLHTHLDALSLRLQDNTWQPSPVKQISVQTFTGKTVPVGIPTVEDRIVHRAMRNCIEPILETYAFLDFVSGYRLGRNRLTAVRQAMNYLNEGRTWIADIDIQDAAGHVTIPEVIEWLACWISDGSFLKRVGRALTGLPNPLYPGSGLSPLLLNLRLVPIDDAIKHLCVVRFADNYTIFCHSLIEAQDAFEAAQQAMSAHNLAPAPQKSRIRQNANPEDLFLIGG